MEHVEVVLVSLLVAVAGLSALATRIGVPYPILLVLGYRRRQLKARAGKTEDDGFEDRSVAYQTMVRSVLEAQRSTIVALRNRGELSNELMHRLRRELDLEDARLEI